MKRNLFIIFTAIFSLVNFAVAQETPQVPVTDPNAAAALAKGYQVGPGDVIAVKVLGESQFDFEATIDENGNIEVPFFDKSISATCKTERELRVEVTKLLSKYLRNPQLNLRVSERKSRPAAIIYGEVRSPQQVILMRKARLHEMISAAGGITEAASGNIQIFRTQAPMCADSKDLEVWNAETNNGAEIPNRIYSYTSLKQGNEAANPVVYPGDIIVVQKTAPVYIIGEIKAPQGVYIPEGGLPLTQALAMVGGPNREAKTKDIKIYRKRANSIERDIISLNLDLIKKGQQKDMMLEPYDVIEVDKAKKNALEVVKDIVIGAGRQAVSGIGAGIGPRILY